MNRRSETMGHLGPIGRTAVFVLATVVKAWEPLSVAVSQRAQVADRQEYPFAALLVVCELMKLGITLPATMCEVYPDMEWTRTSGWRWMPRLCISRDLRRAFAAPALFLAIVNQNLGYAVPRLDPMTYQVVFKAVSVSATAALTRLLLPGRTLGVLRIFSLALLLSGAALCSERPSAGIMPTVSHVPSLPAEQWLRGFCAALVGALSFAIQAVAFEGAAEQAPGGPILHTSAVAFYGLVANTAILCMRQPFAFLSGACCPQARPL